MFDSNLRDAYGLGQMSEGKYCVLFKCCFALFGGMCCVCVSLVGCVLQLVQQASQKAGEAPTRTSADKHTENNGQKRAKSKRNMHLDGDWGFLTFVFLGLLFCFFRFCFFLHAK